MKRIYVLATLMLIGLLLIPSTIALADRDYHTERLPLSIVDEGHSLRNGMVVNIHPEGPVNGAIEKYVLNGANPDTEYEVWWGIDSDDLGELELPTNFNLNGDPFPMIVHTDSQGNGQYTYKISYDYQSTNGFLGFDGMVRWLFKVNGETVFETDWTHIIVDE